MVIAAITGLTRRMRSLLTCAALCKPVDAFQPQNTRCYAENSPGRGGTSAGNNGRLRCRPISRRTGSCSHGANARMLDCLKQSSFGTLVIAFLGFLFRGVVC